MPVRFTMVNFTVVAKIAILFEQQIMKALKICLFQIFLIYGHARKLGFLAFAILGYTHKNLNPNTTYMAYKMVIEFQLMAENKKMMV